jgi:hypothetical protein
MKKVFMSLAIVVIAGLAHSASAETSPQEVPVSAPAVTLLDAEEGGACGVDVRASQIDEPEESGLPKCSRYNCSTYCSNMCVFLGCCPL